MGKRHRKRQKEGSDSRFRIVVASSPNGDGEVSVEPEIDLIKSALLYGDEVTLLSPVWTM